MSPRRARPSTEELLGQAVGDPAGVDDAGWAQLLRTDEPYLEALCGLADAVRAELLAAASGRGAPGEGGADGELTFVVNRNLTTAAVAGPAGSAQADLRDALVDEAVALGATELCVQGPLPRTAASQDGRDDAYLDLVRALHERAPQLHLHAFRPAEVLDAATRSGRTPREWLTAAREAGLGSVPGTGALVLDDALRRRLARGGAASPVPVLSVRQWQDLITTAHEVGLPSTATLVHGHLETPEQQVAHLRRLQGIQHRTGGFTELIAMPWTPALTGPLPDPLPPGLPRSAPGASVRETRTLHAVARTMLGHVPGSIPHVQVAWTKLGGGASPLVEEVLAGGADDLGGLLLDGALAPEAGAEAGLQLTAADVVAVAARLGRTPRQRTTTYADVPPDRRLPLPSP